MFKLVNYLYTASQKLFATYCFRLTWPVTLWNADYEHIFIQKAYNKSRWLQNGEIELKFILKIELIKINNKSCTVYKTGNYYNRLITDMLIAKKRHCFWVTVYMFSFIIHVQSHPSGFRDCWTMRKLKDFTTAKPFIIDVRLAHSSITSGQNGR